MEDRDPHDEHGHEDIEEHAQLDEEGRFVRHPDAEGIDAVLEDEVTKDLAECFLAADDEEETDEHRGQRHGDEQW